MDILDGIASLLSSLTLRHWVLSAKLPLASAVEALLTYLSVNLMAQAFPASFAVVLPDQLKILDPNGDGVLTGTEIEDCGGHLAANPPCMPGNFHGLLLPYRKIAANGDQR